mgnify:FL=1
MDLTWNLNLEFVEMFTYGQLISLTVIKETHGIIIEQEKVTENIHLLTAFYRGLSYLLARKYMEGNVKEFFSQGV